MGFTTIDGLPGLLYVPDDRPERPRKHPCPDCFECQLCSDVRCQLCLKAPCCRRETAPQADDPTRAEPA